MNQTLTQLKLRANTDQYEKKVYTLLKHLDEKVGCLYLAHIGMELDELTADQESYIGVAVDGPYKPESYMY
jgi:adenosylhomocysteinase